MRRTTSPADPLAPAQTASSTPASSFWPSSALKAGSTTSIVPNAKPTGRLARTSVRRPGAASAPSPKRREPASRRLGPLASVQTGEQHQRPAEHAGGRDREGVLRSDGGDDHRRQKRADHEDQLDQAPSRARRRSGSAPAARRAAAASASAAPRTPAGSPRRCRRQRPRARADAGIGRARAPTRAAGQPACTNASGSSARSPRQSISLPWSGAPSALPSASAPAQSPAVGERAAHLLHVEQDREPADADRKAPHDGRDHDRRDARACAGCSRVDAATCVKPRSRRWNRMPSRSAWSAA